MIRITAELVSARTGKTTLLGYAEIVNDGQRTRETQGYRGSYTVRLFRRGSKDRVWKADRVENFQRRSKTMWDLLYLALHKIVGRRNALQTPGTKRKKEP